MLQKELISTITSIIINLISSDVDAKKIKFIERLHIRAFRKGMNKWVKEYVNKNDGTALTTSAFAQYFIYQKPVEKILNYVYEQGSAVSEKDFVAQLVEDCKRCIVSKGYQYVAMDDFVLKHFFKAILHKIKELLYGKLSNDTRILLYSHKQLEANLGQKIEEENDVLFNRIKELLPKDKKITDQQLVCDIYDIINAKLWSGCINEVRSLLPIIEGRNADLELGIQCSLNIMSNEDILSVNPWSDVRKIGIANIRDDVLRKLLLFSLDKKHNLSLIKGQASSEELNNLIFDLIEQERSAVLEKKLKENGVVDTYEFTVTDRYPSEMWLIKRLCSLYLYNEPILIADEMEKLLGEDANFIDKILINTKKINELLSKGTDITADDLATSILHELRSRKENVLYMCHKVQKEYFVTVLRATIICSTTEADAFVSELPEWLKDDEDIQGLFLFLKIEKNEATEAEIIERCKSTGQYWLLNNYLLRQENKGIAILEVLGRNLWLIDKDFNLFILYAQAVRIEKGNTECTELLLGYKDKYKNYIEYWIEMIIMSTEDSVVDEFLEVRSSKESMSILTNSDEKACELLIGCQRYKDAMKIISRIEALGKANEKVLQMKATALMYQGYRLEALSILNTLFEEYPKEERVIDAIIGLSIENRRSISDEVLKAAISIDSSRMLMLSAVVCEENGQHEEAINLIMRALLKSQEQDINTYQNYLVIHMGDKNQSGPEVKKVDVCTSVILEDKRNKDKIVYCIYKKNVLPEEAWSWEGATHISEDRAIQMGLIRKEVGMDIILGDITYVVKEILTLDCYYFRTCMNKIVGAGIAKQILLPAGDDEQSRKEMAEVLKANIPDDGDAFKWLEHYQDMHNMTVTLFSLYKFVNVNYLQFVLVLLEDKSVIFREILNCNEVSGERYMLSFSAMVALYKLGFPIEQYKHKNIYITDSTQREILSEAEDIIARYKKDCVATMGKANGEVFFQESVEEEKQKWMGEAAGIRQYCQQIDTMNNEKDIKVEEFKDFDWKDFLGVCDYDAVAISMNTDVVLVSAEVPIMAISQIKECSVSSVGIVDFLCDMGLTAPMLINYIRKMIDCRFNIIVTDKLIKTLTALYENMTDVERDEFLLQWSECLRSVNELEDRYKENFVSLITDIFKKYHDESRMGNPIWRCFALYVMRYNNIKL